MKQLALLIAFTTLAVHPAFAATTKKKTVVRTQTAATPTPAPVYQEPESQTLQWTGDVGLGTMNSHFAFGFGIHGEVPTMVQNTHFKFGGQTGFYYGSSSGVNYWTIPLLATATYQFNNVDTSFKPYIGLGMGISIDHGSASGSVTVLNTTVPASASATNVNFAIIFKPGLNFGKYYAEVPIGSLQNGFVILPSFGMHFN